MDEDNSDHQPNDSYASDSLESSSNFCPFSDTNSGIAKFHILDEIDNESEGSVSDTESDIPDDEIERMLDDALQDRKRTADEAGLDNDNINPCEERDKVVLIEKGHNHFDILPEGWIKVTHNSGMPLYLHKTTRVCTLSKPYFLGSGSVRKHYVPLSSIPCLSYRTAVTEENEKAASITRNDTMPETRIETATENTKTCNLTPEQLTKYCEALFQFRNIRVMRFKSWTQRRKFTKRKKHERQLQRPTLPDGTKLITFPIVENGDGTGTGSFTKREWTMNPTGKSYVCILHEFVQHALKKQPSYKFTELENAATPYAATISINDMQYGIGYGTSKKQAKSEAARATLEILIPEMRSKITADKSALNTSKSDNDLSFFDEIKIEDPRVAEFCAKTTEPSPHDILLTCLQRNFGSGNIEIEYQGNTLKHQKNEFTMTVGKHKATVICTNKRDGKQRASQAILQALHPHITSWGSLLRLYGNRSVKSFKDKKMEEQEITLLQSKASINSPNFAILDKLRTELLKISDHREAIKPIGIFIPPETQQMPTFSSSNLKKLDL